MNEYKIGQFHKTCSNCNNDSFKILGTGKTFCVKCATNFKGLPGFGSDDVDEMSIALNAQLVFLTKLWHEEKDGAIKSSIKARVSRVEKILTKLKEATARQHNAAAANVVASP